MASAEQNWLNDNAAAQAAQHAAQASARTSLLQEAYSHPLDTALIAGGAAALAGAALYLSRGRVAGLLEHSKPGVLLIEDTPAMGKAMQAALEEQGHAVQWVTGIKSIDPLTAVAPDGAELSLETAGLGKKLQVALVDGDLGKNSLSGPDIIPALTEHHVTSIGTSAVPSFNEAMQAQGAPIAANKSVVFTSLLGHRLDLRAAVRAPQAVQERLQAFGASFLKPENGPLRKAADAYLMKYLSP